MRLGARWQAGDPPHPSVPAALHGEISAQESALPDARAWTLTWLEGRPYCELDGLVVVGLSPAGEVTVSEPGARTPSGETPEDDDDWLR